MHRLTSLIINNNGRRNRQYHSCDDDTLLQHAEEKRKSPKADKKQSPPAAAAHRPTEVTSDFLFNAPYRSLALKKGHSTAHCTDVLKRTTDYYTSRGSHVFLCFINFTKAFDKVNYWKLFMKLLDDNINSSIVSLLAFWYSHQQVCVRWRNTLSDWFLIGNGTRQGSILSPYLFAR